MDSVQNFSFIESIAAKPRKTEKIAHLSGHAADESVRQVLDLALNPFDRFGVREFLERRVNGRADPMRRAVWADIDNWRDAIICVETNGFLAPKKAGDKHSLFLPVFVEQHDDKRSADTLSRIEDIIESATKA